MMDIVDFIAIAVTFAGLGAFAGWYGRELYAKRVVAKMSKEFTTRLKQRIEDYTIEVDITKVDGGFIVHRTSGEFLVQGETHEDISEKLNKMYPGYTFTATAENLASVGYTHNEPV